MQLVFSTFLPSPLLSPLPSRISIRRLYMRSGTVHKNSQTHKLKQAQTKQTKPARIHSIALHGHRGHNLQAPSLHRVGARGPSISKPLSDRVYPGSQQRMSESTRKRLSSAYSLSLRRSCTYAQSSLCAFRVIAL
jgi:hypothetical protein